MTNKAIPPKKEIAELKAKLQVIRDQKKMMFAEMEKRKFVLPKEASK